jgi:hypothetical protein
MNSKKVYPSLNEYGNPNEGEPPPNGETVYK